MDQSSDLDSFISPSNPPDEMELLIEEARELNLVGTISSRKKTKNKKKHKKDEYHQQYLKYLVVIDFEATCWQRKTQNQHEIIEFPAILYNLQKRQKESEFREFVKPTERPKLSEFCTNLTGITQDLVDNGNIITEVLNRFHDWLADILTRKKLCLPKTDIDNLNGNIAFVTWSDWDFGVCLKRELTRKSIKKPLYYNNWIDLQAVYKKKYHYRPMNFSDSLRHLNMEFEGRPHCGMDDAKNLARLAGRLADDGALIAITTDLQPQRILYRPFFSY